ncbi:glutathione S-transferase, amine-terminal domain protein (macronuclear) [Tetrahymena thermophila SB210]|uniref:glutathione transferase n=1 Tax=Tetrahymena thermophila (strain SB210) TaxID=312017 RepID=A4VDZ7_TETTS|nr:glutathione S-transferase, amine-terminal domain protein [Tetrahymena thermophila SB210]EDK31763.1 glutathione S-transferase, amine-terminal domain protein [Tetrahymena thermophila SB210]|eukprot:XP_001470781.1 glutathione S-transferase, amine-terminal domain protein [Tetrahymena thermophila SB210]
MIVLGYWNLRGYAQPIRLLLEYLQVEYKDKLYHENGEEWFNTDKQELKTNFPNLPYLIDGDVVVTESIVIPIYLAKKFKKYELIGQNNDGSFNQNEIIFLEILSILKDLRDTLNSSARVPSFKQEKDKIFNEKFNVTFEKIKKQLGENKFLLGNLSYIDFYFYEVLKIFKFFYPNLSIFTDYIDRIENIPQIKNYLETKENKIFLLDRMKSLYYY